MLFLAMLSEELSGEKKKRGNLCHQNKAVSPTTLGPSPHSSSFKKIHFFISWGFFYSTTAASFSISLHLIPGYETSKHGAATVHKTILRDSHMPSDPEMQVHLGQTPIPFPLSKLTLKLLHL